MENLKEKTTKGLFWGAMNSGATQLLNLAIGILLGRLLSPGDWGLVGMLAIFSAIAGNLQSSGFSTAIVNMKQPRAKDYNAVFWFNILMSMVLYALLFAAAPLIAWFFNEPKLTSLARLMFLSFLISSFGISTNAYMTKNMMNREIAIVNFVALVTGGVVGVTLAAMGMEYWSIAWQQIVNSAVLVLGRFWFVEWKPRLSFDFEPIRRTFRFSMNILGTMVINTLNANLLTFVFGKIYGRNVTGNFFQAYKWDSMAFSTVCGMLDQVAQPVMVSVRDENNTQREVRIFRKLTRFAAFLAFPAMFGLALVANEFIIIALTDKWADSIVPLQLLCLSGAFMPLYSLYKNLIISQGRSDINLWLNIGQVVLQLLVIVAFRRAGFIAMVAAWSAFNILWLVVWHYYARRLIGVRFRDTLADICPFMLAALGVMALTWFCTLPIKNIYVLLPVRIVLAAALYFGIMKVAGAVILEECLAFISSKFKKQNK